MGLGLSICREFMRARGGALYLAKGDGRNTVALGSLASAMEPVATSNAA